MQFTWLRSNAVFGDVADAEQGYTLWNVATNAMQAILDNRKHAADVGDRVAARLQRFQFAVMLGKEHDGIENLGCIAPSHREALRFAIGGGAQTKKGSGSFWNSRYCLRISGNSLPVARPVAS